MCMTSGLVLAVAYASRAYAHMAPAGVVILGLVAVALFTFRRDARAADAWTRTSAQITGRSVVAAVVVVGLMLLFVARTNVAASCGVPYNPCGCCFNPLEPRWWCEFWTGCTCP